MNRRSFLLSGAALIVAPSLPKVPLPGPRTRISWAGPLGYAPPRPTSLPMPGGRGYEAFRAWQRYEALKEEMNRG